MTYKILEIVALNHEISEYGLAEGETGTIVDVYNAGVAYEVEFVNPKGETIALLTLDPSDLHSLGTDPIFKWESPIWGGIKQSSVYPVTSSHTAGTTQFFYNQL